MGNVFTVCLAFEVNFLDCGISQFDRVLNSWTICCDGQNAATGCEDGAFLRESACVEDDDVFLTDVSIRTWFRFIVILPEGSSPISITFPFG